MNYLKACPKPVRKKREPILRVTVEENPLECIEQETVAAWLDAKKVLYTATMAGSFLHPATFNRMKRMGLKRGVSDILIFDPPPAYIATCKLSGVCLEMKRKKGGQLSEEQKEWLEKMKDRDWLCYVALGADQAIEFLEKCGYGGKK